MMPSLKSLNFLRAAVLLCGLVFGLTFGNTSISQTTTDPRNYGGSTDVDRNNQVCTAAGAVAKARAACAAWIKNADASKKTKSHDDDDTADSETDDSDFRDFIDKAKATKVLTLGQLQQCEEEYELKGSCDKMPMKASEDDDPDNANDKQVYDPSAKTASNSPACKAKYAKKFGADKKTDFDILDKAQTKNNDAQKALADAMSDEQKNESQLQQDIQDTQVKLKDKLFELQNSMTHEKQATKDKLNSLLAEVNSNTEKEATIRAEMQEIKTSYENGSRNLQNECKTKIRQQNAMGGGVPAPNMDYLSKCVLQGGSQVCQCKVDIKYLNEQEAKRAADQEKLIELEGQLRQTSVAIASATNQIKNANANLTDDAHLAQTKVAQETQDASAAVAQKTKTLQQMQMTAQQNMVRLQAQAKTAQEQLAEASEDYKESSAAFKSLKAYAGKSSSDDDNDAVGADPTLTSITKGVENFNLANGQCNGNPFNTGELGDPAQGGSGAGTSAAAAAATQTQSTRGTTPGKNSTLNPSGLQVPGNGTN